jgi:hypothetical protein
MGQFSTADDPREYLRRGLTRIGSRAAPLLRESALGTRAMFSAI